MSKNSSFRGYVIIVGLVLVSFLLVSSLLKSLRPEQAEEDIASEPVKIEAEPAVDEQTTEPKEPQSPQVWQGAM
jgi:hypothetical protein